MLALKSRLSFIQHHLPPWVDLCASAAARSIAHFHWSLRVQALFIMVAGVMLARISPSGCAVVCTLTYAMSVAMYLSTQDYPQNICKVL